MTIKLVKGFGEGKTALSSFDSALKNAGVYNYNLIQLSSVIPPGTKVERVPKFSSPYSEHGYKLYVVKAEMRSMEAGKFIAAGIGWYQYDDGRGLFVEHELIGETQIAVESEMEFRINNSLEDLCRFRNLKFDKKNFKAIVSATKVKDHPTCVLALAVYQSESWEKV